MIIEINKQTQNKEKSNYSTEVRTTDDMYFDYKKKQDKLKILKKSFDLEQGLTFKPHVNSSSNIIVTSSFDERNAKNLEYKRLLNELGNNPIFNNKRYTSTEIKKNNKRVVERLYQKDLDKVISKNLRTSENRIPTGSKYQNNYPNENNHFHNHSPTNLLTFQQDLQKNNREDNDDENCEKSENHYETEKNRNLHRADGNLFKR